MTWDSKTNTAMSIISSFKMYYNDYTKISTLLDKFI